MDDLNRQMSNCNLYTCCIQCGLRITKESNLAQNCFFCHHIVCPECSLLTKYQQIVCKECDWPQNDSTPRTKPKKIVSFNDMVVKIES